MTTAAIRMGDGHVVHSCGDCELEVPMGSRTIVHRFYVMDTEAFDFVSGTDFFVQHSQILKRYPEPMAHGPEACEPSHLLTPAVSGISLFSNPRNLESDF